MSYTPKPLWETRIEIGSCICVATISHVDKDYVTCEVEIESQYGLIKTEDSFYYKLTDSDIRFLSYEDSHIDSKILYTHLKNSGFFDKCQELINEKLLTTNKVRVSKSEEKLKKLADKLGYKLVKV